MHFQDTELNNPDAVLVFISPCVAKRAEGHNNDNIDYVMNYEELGALFVAKQIQITECEEGEYVVGAIAKKTMERDIARLKKI